MDRQSTSSSSVYDHNDEFGAMKNIIDARLDAQMEELKVLIKNHKRPSSSYAQVHMLPSYHLRQDQTGIDTINDMKK